MSASSKAAERDPLLPYARQFGSIRENEDENDDGKRFERRGASSDDVENGRKKTFFLFDHGGAHASRDASSGRNTRFVFIRFTGVRFVLLRRDGWFLLLAVVKDDFDVEGRWCRFGKRTTPAKSTPSARDDGDDRKRSRSEDCIINVDEQQQ
jgi:hypothetical protein